MEKDIYIDQMCATQPFYTKGNFTFHHFRWPLPLTQWPDDTKSHNEHLCLKISIHFIWKYLQEQRCYGMDIRTHKHWTAILTTMSSSVQAGLTMVLWQLSIMLQSISKIQCGETNSDICIRPLTSCKLDLHFGPKSHVTTKH
jgi:hypothetical protein